MENKLNSWLQRDRSMVGRIYPTNMESLSRCIFLTCCHSRQTLQPHCMKNGCLIKGGKDGGLKATDVHSLNGTSKINIKDDDPGTLVQTSYSVA